MKRLFVIVLLLATTAAFAQEKKELDPATAKQFRSRVFEIHNRDPRQIADTIRLLGSGVAGTAVTINTELKTLTVRDFPENIATMDEAIKRLDQPAPPTPDITFKISVLIGSKSPLTAASIPDDLEPVVKQLQSALRYAHYGLMTTSIQRTKPGDLVEGSGVAEATLLGLTPSQDRPIMYSYKMLRVTANDSSVDLEKFEFNMHVPIAIKTGEVQYQNVGFDTPVTLRNGEKVVIGTTSMGDKALIVVVTATR